MAGSASAQTPTVTLTVVPSEVSENGGVSRLTATLSNTINEEVRVNLRINTSQTTASSGDFVGFGPDDLEIIIPANAESGFNELVADDDTDVEGDEQIVFEITTITTNNATENGNQSATLTILDDDDPATLTLTAAPPTIDEAGGQSTITATLDQATNADVVVTLTTDGDADGSALASTTLTIPRGSTEATTTLDAREDADVDDETVTVAIGSTTGGNVTVDTPSSATVTITDNDAPPALTVELTASPTQIAEDGSQGASTITATLVGGTTDEEVTVTLAATGDSDAFTLDSPTITIPANGTSGSTTLTADDDADFDNDDVTVEITAISGDDADTSDDPTEAGGDQSVTVTITDTDVPSVTLSVSDNTIAEGEDTQITATLSDGQTASSPVTVTLAYQGGAGEFTAPTQIVIPAGANSAFVTFSATDDTDDEANVDVEVSIAAVAGDAVENGDQTQTITITDNDAAPLVTLSAQPTEIAERNGRSTLTARLGSRSDQPVTVTLAYSGTATRGTDFTAPDQIVIPAGQTSATVDVVSTADATDDDDETVIVDVASVTNGTEDGTQQVTITLDEDLGTATVSFADVQASVSEGEGTYDLQLELSEALDSEATVTVTLSQGDPADLGGFTTRTVTIPAGSTSVSVPITLTDDDVREDDETFTFQLTSDDDRLGVDLGTTILTVTDDDVTAFVINEFDGIVGDGAFRFVELRVDGAATGSADGLTLAVYGPDSTVAATLSLDDLDAGDDGYLVLCDSGGDAATCDATFDASDLPADVSGVALFRNEGPLAGSDFDEDDDELVDSVFIDERAAAEERAVTDNSGVEAEDGSLQRRADGRFAFVAPPTPGAMNIDGIAVPTTPVTPLAEAVGDVFPNPSAGRAEIELTVASAQTVRVSVYDALGRQVAVAYDGEARPGTAVRVALGGAGFAPGVYIVRVAGETFTEARRLTVAR